MYIALRERDGDASLIECIVNNLFLTVYEQAPFRNQHKLLHGNLHGTVPKVPETDVYAKLGLNYGPSLLILGLQHFQSLRKHSTDLLYVHAVCNAHSDLCEFILVVPRKVLEALSKKVCIEEGYKGA